MPSLMRFGIAPPLVGDERPRIKGQRIGDGPGRLLLVAIVAGDIDDENHGLNIISIVLRIARGAHWYTARVATNASRMYVHAPW